MGAGGRVCGGVSVAGGACPVIKSDLPATAITAALNALSSAMWASDPSDAEIVRATLEAAAPAIRAQAAAAEREACAQIARQVNARYETSEMPDYTAPCRRIVLHPFADLIGDPQ